MLPADTSGQSKKRKPTSLSEQAHQQVMDFLSLADKSANPDLRVAAIEIAKQTSKYHQKQGARVSPTLILWVDLTLGIALAAACWYASLHYSDKITAEVSSIAIRVYLVIVGISLFLSGHLSQANFMKVLGWLESQAKSVFNYFRPSRDQKGSADDVDNTPSKPK